MLAEAAAERVASFALPRVQDEFAVRPRGSLRRVRRGGRAVAPGPMKVAFVVPRYGPTIIGGAETAARAFAEHLVAESGVGTSRS